VLGGGSPSRDVEGRIDTVVVQKKQKKIILSSYAIYSKDYKKIILKK